jgi:hypothetical protein
LIFFSIHKATVDKEKLKEEEKEEETTSLPPSIVDPLEEEERNSGGVTRIKVMRKRTPQKEEKQTVWTARTRSLANTVVTVV